MDRGRSFGLPGNMQQTMTVAQTEDQIEVETKLIMPDNERTVKDTYVLDGKEHEFTPPLPPNAAPNAPAPKGKRTANWLPNWQWDRGDRSDHQRDAEGTSDYSGNEEMDVHE